MLTTLLSGLALGLSVAAPLGPVNVAAIRRGLTGGFWPSLLFGIGAATADSFYIVVVYLGVAPLILALDGVRLALWAGGAFWLTRIALGALRTPATAQRPTGGERKEWNRSFLDGVGMTLLNPMTIASWLVIGGGAFASLGGSLAPGVAAAYVFSIFAGSALWFSGLAVALHFARRWVSGKALRVVSIICAALLFGFATWFGVQAWGLIGEWIAAPG